MNGPISSMLGKVPKVAIVFFFLAFVSCRGEGQKDREMVDFMLPKDAAELLAKNLVENQIDFPDEVFGGVAIPAGFWRDGSDAEIYKASLRVAEQESGRVRTLIWNSVRFRGKSVRMLAVIKISKSECQWLFHRTRRVE